MKHHWNDDWNHQAFAGSIANHQSAAPKKPGIPTHSDISPGSRVWNLASKSGSKHWKKTYGRYPGKKEKRTTGQRIVKIQQLRASFYNSWLFLSTTWTIIINHEHIHSPFDPVNVSWLRVGKKSAVLQSVPSQGSFTDPSRSNSWG